LNSVSARGSSPRDILVGAAALALFLAALFGFAARAQAAETLYWDNYGATPDNVAFANIDGTGGGLLNLGTAALDSPEGMAYDTVTNRLFVASQGGVNGQILAINLDGSGAAPFTAPGAPIASPEGVAVDPAPRIIYWVNNEKSEESIAWAKLDGSAGGVLSTAGTTLEGPCCRMAVDPVGGRVYFTNSGRISYANVNNTGGGDLNLIGSTVKPGGEGLVVDPAAGRLYFLGGNGEIGFANLNGTGGGDVPAGTGVFKTPWGLALDPSIGRLYWGNEGNGEVRENAFGFVGVGGAGGAGISIATAPVANPQDPLIIKSPAGVGAPTQTRDAKVRSQLTCSPGSWGADFAGSFVYRAPRTFAYQWTLNGAAVAGAIANSLTATKAGQYACVVTAANQAGTASQASAPAKITASKIKLTVKKKVKARPGGVAKFKFSAANQGDLKSKQTKVCVKLQGKAKKDLKAPKCKALGKLNSRGKRTATLKIKVGSSAVGTYAITFQVRGSGGKATKAKLQIVG
jgi:DNA-binding beta-propeller fold protein YncE